MNAVWIIGTGPAALVAADYLAAKGIPVKIADRRPAPGWKLLVAGASGLNVAHDCADADLPKFYPARGAELAKCFAQFGRDAWLGLLHEIGEPTYLGSSRRYFLENKTAGSLLAKWRARLESKGAEFHFGEELADVTSSAKGVELRFASGRLATARTVLLALGGPSWEEKPSTWPKIFQRQGIQLSPFRPANAGYSFRAPDGFFAQHEGKPIKGLTLTTARGVRQGELMITKYGIEGTPVYTVGTPGPATMDLKPDLTEARLAERLQSAPGDIEKKIMKQAKLSPGALALFLALSPADAWTSPARAAHYLKNLPVELLAPRSLADSISASGGLSWEELDENLQLRKLPGVYCAGEMVDWDAPTGGFLIQASVAMGRVAAEAMARALP